MLTHATRNPHNLNQVHFYRPKTVKLARNPKYARKSVPHMTKMDKYRLIRYPLTTGASSCALSLGVGGFGG